MAVVERSHFISLVGAFIGASAVMATFFLTCARSSDQQIAINTQKLIRIENVDIPELKHHDELQTNRIDILEQRCPAPVQRQNFDDVEANGAKP